MKKDKQILQAELKSVIAKDSASLWKLQGSANKLFLYSEKHDDGIKAYYLDKEDLLESKNITSTSTPTIDSDDIKDLNRYLTHMTGHERSGNFSDWVQELVNIMHGEYDDLRSRKLYETEELNNEVLKLKDEKTLMSLEALTMKDEIERNKIGVNQAEVDALKKDNSDLRKEIIKLNFAISDKIKESGNFNDDEYIKVGKDIKILELQEEVDCWKELYDELSEGIDDLNEYVSDLEKIMSFCREEMSRLDKIILNKDELNEEIDDLKEENWEQYREISWLKDDVRSRDAKILTLEEEIEELKGGKTNQQ